jgi:hypothetical protein
MANRRILYLTLIGLGMILAALLFRIGMAWFLENYDLVYYEQRTGFKPEARRNPLLAAERYLKRIGADVESISTTDLWRNLPEPGDAIIVYRFSPPAGEARRQALRRWIEDGGHLIVEADDSLLLMADMDERQLRSNEERVDLLDELGISLHEHEAAVFSKLLTGDEPIKVQFQDSEEAIEVDFNTYRYLLADETRAEPSGKVPCGKGYCLLQYELGEGMVTVMNDISFIDNYSIGNHDHAMVLALLYPHPPKRTWLVYDVVMPSLFQLMWRHLPYALTALLVALLLWLWQKSGRLGPLLPPLDQPRRNIDEHLQATAGFLWRIDRGKQLFLSNQRTLKQAWFSKHFLLRSMPRNEGCAWIAARTGLSPEAVKRALYDSCESEQEFIELSSYLQILKMAL